MENTPNVKVWPSPNTYFNLGAYGLGDFFRKILKPKGKVVFVDFRKESIKKFLSNEFLSFISQGDMVFIYSDRHLLPLALYYTTLRKGVYVFSRQEKIDVLMDSLRCFPKNNHYPKSMALTPKEFELLKELVLQELSMKAIAKMKQREHKDALFA